MPTPTRKRVSERSPAPAWNEIVHDLANDLAGAKLLLVAVAMATEEQERERHLAAIKQSVSDAELRLQALRSAVRRELAAAGKAGSKPSARKA